MDPPHPPVSKGYESPLQTVWNLLYSIGDEKLGRLYEKAIRDQWNADRALDWANPTDIGALIKQSDGHTWTTSSYVQRLPRAKQEALLLHNVAFDLSQFLHGEQAALMVAAQLVNAVPDYEAKLYASTQVVDEARHMQVFERYCKRIGRIYPVQRELEIVLDAVLQAKRWQSKLVTMQMLVEGTALAAFLNMRRCVVEPLLTTVLDYVLKDESRHVGFGTSYLKRSLQALAPEERAEVEDFTFETIQALRPVRMGTARQGAFVQVLLDSEIDPDEFAEEVAKDIQEGWKPSLMPGQVHNFRDIMMPLIVRVGLVSDRMVPRYRDVGIRVSDDQRVLERVEEEGNAIEIRNPVAATRRTS